MVWAPIDLTVPQYQNPSDNTPYSGAVLKAYLPGGTTNTPMATDNTGGTTFTSVALNSSGYPEHAAAIVIPHIDRAYKLALYANQTAADADTGAIWAIDNLSIVTPGLNLLDDANNATMEPVINVTKTTSGTPANGHGASLSYTVETTASNNEIGMELGAAVEDNSAGSEDFKLLVKLMKGGAAASDVFEVGSTGTMKFLIANPQCLGGDTDGIFTVGAGATNILGSNAVFYGDTHSTKADDFEIYGSATLQAHYDDSGSLWDFQANAITTAGAITGAAGTLSSLVLASGATITAFLDEDTMSSDSNTAGVTQQSVKAYVDTKSLVFISAQTASTDATIDFTGIDSTYDEYEIHLLNVIPVTDSVWLAMRTDSDGGVSFDAGASDYSWGNIYPVGSTPTSTTNAADTEIQLTPSSIGSIANELGVSCVVKLIRPSEATFTTVSCVGTYTNESTVATPFTASGFRASAADVDAVQFLFESGSVESGLFALYGVRRA